MPLPRHDPVPRGFAPEEGSPRIVVARGVRRRRLRRAGRGPRSVPRVALDARQAERVRAVDAALRSATRPRRGADRRAERRRGLARDEDRLLRVRARRGRGRRKQRLRRRRPLPRRLRRRRKQNARLGLGLLRLPLRRRPPLPRQRLRRLRLRPDIEPRRRRRRRTFCWRIVAIRLLHSQRPLPRHAARRAPAAARAPPTSEGKATDG
mmetsp:Transcript_30820/g.99377  ORF Transcript_30820/g.99377 Transcript_30820/m.99377 type:complete len:208 (+) Transcript_30820:1111-1734(+)